MGRSNRRSHHSHSHPPASHSGPVPCSSKMSEKKPMHSVDSTHIKPVSSSLLDITDSSMKLRKAHSATEHQNPNLGRSIYLKRSHTYHYGHQYSRRSGSTSRATNPSTACVKGVLRDDPRLSFKLASLYNSDSRAYHPGITEDPHGEPEIISNSSITESLSADMAKMECGICQKLLLQVHYYFGDTIGQLSNVAVLACGHVYHAGCLEQRTVHAHRLEPQCPVCSIPASSSDQTKQE